MSAKNSAELVERRMRLRKVTQNRLVLHQGRRQIPLVMSLTYEYRPNCIAVWAHSIFDVSILFLNAITMVELDKLGPQCPL